MASEIIGYKEITNGIKEGKVKKVLVANNCPQHLVDEIRKTDVVVEEFDGDQEKLGTKFGKPFPVALVGLKE